MIPEIRILLCLRYETRCKTKHVRALDYSGAGDSVNPCAQSMLA